MRIYIITCNNAYNYGAVLQAYGLSKYLENEGHSCEIVNFVPPHLRKISKKYRKNIFAIIVRNILYWPDYSRSSKIFKDFRKKYLTETKLCYNISDISELLKADLYICGSDQIWNPDMENGYCKEYYFDFKDRVNKISYAASIGKKIIDKNFLLFLKYELKDFSYITVREKRSVEDLKKVGVKSDYVIDPVFLLSGGEWKELIQKENFKDQDYVLVYALHHIQKVYDYARKLAFKQRLKLYVISVEIREIFRGNDKFFWNPSVNDFISLFSSAKAVVSNSFHGISLAIIFRIPLHIFDTEKDDIRISNIVEIFKLKNRIVKRPYNLLENKESFDSCSIDSEICRSKNILEEMLRGSMQ